MKALKELEDFLLEHSVTLLCADVSYSPSLWRDGTAIRLRCNHTPSEYAVFLDQMSFDYDNGYGGQELFGTLWFTDGTWADRGEYDGSEWWEYHKLPEIPEELKC